MYIYIYILCICIYSQFYSVMGYPLAIKDNVLENSTLGWMIFRKWWSKTVRTPQPRSLQNCGCLLKAEILGKVIFIGYPIHYRSLYIHTVNPQLHPICSEQKMCLKARISSASIHGFPIFPMFKARVFQFPSFPHPSRPFFSWITRWNCVCSSLVHTSPGLHDGNQT